MILKNLKISYKINSKNKKSSYYTITYFLFNYLSHIPISLLLFFKVRPNTITNFNIIITALSVYFLYLLNEQTLKLGIILYFITLLIDKCDGGLARIYKSKTFYGKYLDGLIDIVGYSLIFYGIGLNILTFNQDETLEVILMFAVVFFVIDNFILDRYSAIARWCNAENKSNISPLIKQNKYFQIFSNFVKQDIVNIILVLIALTPPKNSLQEYYLFTFSFIWILSGSTSLLLNTISAYQNFNLPKK